MSRYHIYTDARHPNGTLAAASLLSIYCDAAMSALIALYADETSETLLENPYTVPITGLCDFWVEDVTPWVLAENDTTPHPTYVNIGIGSDPWNVRDYGAVGDGGNDDASAIQTAVDLCGTTGGTVFFPAGTYLLGTPIDIPKSNTQRLVLSGYGSTIKLSDTAKAAFRMNASADHQVFRHIAIEGFDIDCADIDGDRWSIIGVSTVDLGIDEMLRLNFDDILIRDIHMYNLPSSADYAVSSRNGVSLSTWQMAESEATQNYLTNITVERVRVEGGDTGVAVGGYWSGGGDDGNIWIDSITFRDCYQAATAPRAIGCNAFFIGSGAYGGAGLISGCVAVNAGDCGFEVNSLSQVTVENCTAVDCTTGFYHNNYNSHVSLGQRVLFRGCHDIKDSVSGWGFAGATPSSAPAGDLVLENCTVRVNGNVSPNGIHYLAYSARSITIKGFSFIADGWTLASPSWDALWLETLDGPVITLSDIHVVIRGTNSSATPGLTRVLFCSGPGQVLHIDGMDMDLSCATNPTQGWPMALGQGAGDTLSADIRGVRLLACTGHGAPLSYPNVIQLDDLSLDYYDCDWSAATDMDEDFAATVPKRSKIRTHNCQFIAAPAPAPYSVGGSPDTCTNTDYYDEDVEIHGGTVSKVEISTNAGTTFTDTYLTAGLFRLRCGDKLRITHTGAPAVTKIPRP